MASNNNFLYYKQAFGRDCSSVIGYNDKTLEFIIQNSQGQPKISFLNSSRVQILKIKQVDKRENISSDILEILEVSPREMVIFVS